MKKKNIYYFPNERNLFNIGGKMQTDYETFRTCVLFVNANYIPLYLALGFSSGKYTDIVLDSILGQGKSAKTLYIERMTDLVDKGVIPQERFLGQGTLKERENETPEEKERRYKNQVHRALVYLFKDIYNDYVDTYKPASAAPSLYPIQVSRKALELTENGLTINVDKFIEIYTDFVEADSSITKKRHQEAAEALNVFFNGAVAITDEEIHRYFSFDSGIAEININSVNGASYARLGKRVPKITKKDEEKDCNP